MLLEEINDNLSSIPGIGDKTKKVFEKVNIYNIFDLLTYFPRKYSDRTETVTLRQAVLKDEATVEVTVTDYRTIRKGPKKNILKIMITDGADYGCLVCFNRTFLQNSLLIGQKYLISGKFSFNFGEFQCSTFEYEDVNKTFDLCNKPSHIIPIYSLTEKLQQKTIRNAIFSGLKKYLQKIENDLPEQLIQKNGLISSQDLLRNMHYPINLEMYIKSKKTLIYKEFFYQQLFLLARKNKNVNTNKKRKLISFEYKNKILQTLPFKLTDYQSNALKEIENDLFNHKVMGRLLQGDVGCGKTIVAIIAMVDVVEAGQQCAIMVPTEMLAKQHYNNICKICSYLHLNIGILEGKQKKSERNQILSAIKSGEIQIIVGTHSLFSKDVEYNDLGLAIIDEQHRFGVEQRMALQNKGIAVDLLLMTATPIPQSLALSLYGDLDLTTMQGKISGRKPIKTWLIDDNNERKQKMYEWIKTLLDNNGRAIIVYARIDENDVNEDDNNLYDLTTQYANLQQIFADYGTAMLHSKVNEDEKDAIISDFRSGKIKLLAATTVIEVGMDIPDANVIVIENAERFGLATLHQLRGRVGRNNKDAYMILISKLENLTDEGHTRLNIIKNSSDGFKIAEEDLMLRGPGDFIGLKQSGLPENLTNIKQELSLLEKSRDDAKLIFENDPNLEKIEHLNIKKTFLYRLNTINSLEKK